jgi:hypothetical protein
VIAETGLDLIAHVYPAWTRASYSSATLAQLARLPYVAGFKVGQRDMNKYAADIKAIRDADATKAILTCHDEYLLASMVQGIDGALVGFATFIPGLINDLLLAVRAGDLRRAMQIQDVITPLKDAVYGARRADGRGARSHEDGHVPRRCHRLAHGAPADRGAERHRDRGSAERGRQCGPAQAPDQQRPRGGKMKMGRKEFIRIAFAAVLAGLAIPASAQTYPTRSVTIIIPFPPGGTLDFVGRMLAQKLSDQLGQSFVVENRPGGGGTIGAGAVANAQPNGYTLLFNASTFTTTPMAMATPPYDIVKDFTPVALVAMAPLAVAVRKDLPVSDVKGLISHAKANPGKLSFAVGSTASADTSRRSC